jgi:riboflavin kinase/FMN adenylyltransferase
VANLGVRPTVSAGFSVEVHLLDFDADLYGSRLRVHFVERLRDELKFANLAALTAQIGEDIAAARQLLSGRNPDPAARGAWV